MITEQEFINRQGELNKVHPLIPFNWGARQNNGYDKLIPSSIYFTLKTLADLDRELLKFSHRPDFQIIKNYYYHRWFKTICAECDEYLFYRLPNVISNPEKKDANWDICFFNKIYFDIKSSVIFRVLRNDLQYHLNDPTQMLYKLYAEQSSGQRQHYQDRLFLIHHSYIDDDREFKLRLQFKFKGEVAEKYTKTLSKPDYKFFQLDRLFNVSADIIYIFENLDGSLTYKIASETLNQN